MPLFFRIQPSLPQPAYRQIVEAVQGSVARDDLRGGERLPSIRNLAADLSINPNTVARAYRELEHLGVIASRLGSGFEVRGEDDAAGDARRKLAEAVGEAVKALGEKEVLRLVREAIKEASEVTHGRR